MKRSKSVKVILKIPEIRPASLTLMSREVDDSVVNPIELDYKKMTLMMMMMMRKMLLDTLTVNMLPYNLLMRQMSVLITMMKRMMIMLSVLMMMIMMIVTRSITTMERQKQKDEAFYQREERALKQASLPAKLQKHIEEARSMRKLAHQLVRYGKVCTIDNLSPSMMRVVIIVDFLSKHSNTILFERSARCSLFLCSIERLLFRNCQL